MCNPKQWIFGEQSELRTYIYFSGDWSLSIYP